MRRGISPEKLKLAKLYEEGNTDLKTFCKLHEVHKSSLYYWRKKLNEEEDAPPSKFVSIDIDTISTELRVEIQLCSGERIITNQFPPLSYLKSLIAK